MYGIFAYMLLIFMVKQSANIPVPHRLYGDWTKIIGHQQWTCQDLLGAIIEKSLPEKQPAVAVNEFPSTWNPQNQQNPLPKKNSNLKICVAFTKYLKP